MYKLVPRTVVPPGRKRIKSKWVFQRKADGSFKGRLVLQGWNQVPGLDCGSTFAPVCRLPSVRMTACIVVHFGRKWDDMDVSTVFLHADILEKVFVEQPPGVEVKDKDGRDLVMQLEKSFYGLAKALGPGFTPLTPSLLRSGSSRSSPTRASTCTTTTVSGPT